MGHYFLDILYVYIEESFDPIFIMGYGSGKSPMDERVKKCYFYLYQQNFCHESFTSRGGGRVNQVPAFHYPGHHQTFNLHHKC